MHLITSCSFKPALFCRNKWQDMDEKSHIPLKSLWYAKFKKDFSKIDTTFYLHIILQIYIYICFCFLYSILHESLWTVRFWHLQHISIGTRHISNIQQPKCSWWLPCWAAWQNTQEVLRSHGRGSRFPTGPSWTLSRSADLWAWHLKILLVKQE